MPPLHRNQTSFSNISTQTNVSIRTPEDKLESGTALSPLSPTSESKNSNGEVGTIPQKIYRRLHPKSREDVRQMYSEVEQWREYKWEEIENDGSINCDERKRRKSLLLNQQTILLRKIEALDKRLIQKADDRTKKLHLDSMSSGDRLWTMSNGEQILVETPASRWAAQMIKVYRKLAAFDEQNASERLEVLTATKGTVDTINVPAAKELIDLINREREMLSRSMSSSLSGLRTRSLNLFLRIIEDERNKITTPT